jgi:hypothetical protein
MFIAVQPEGLAGRLQIGVVTGLWLYEVGDNALPTTNVITPGKRRSRQLWNRQD